VLGDVGPILVTGASGYIGGRLVGELVDRHYRVRAMVRRAHPGYAARWPSVEVVEADVLDPASLDKALKGVYAAYYLIHSMMLGPEEFAEADRRAAQAFAEAAARAGVKRIIYLGGLGDAKKGCLSSHLRNRIEVGEILRAGQVPTTVLRSAIVLGSGSASYEILSHLVRRMPLIPIPRWGDRRCQPVAIRDILKYLVGSLEVAETTGLQLDVGGHEVLSYREMIREMAKVLGRSAWLVPSPVSHPKRYGYGVSLLTPVPYPIVSCLMDSLQNDVVCEDTLARKYLPFKTMGFADAVKAAQVREDADDILSRWSDAKPREQSSVRTLASLSAPAQFQAHHTLVTDKPAQAIFQSFCRVGGKTGWFRSNFLWRLRGLFDRLLGGPGNARGRKQHAQVQFGEVIDFWRVEDIVENERLLLRAEMIVPGDAWLEFKILPAAHHRALLVSAYFVPRGLLGRLYWIVLVPFHKFIFEDLARQIERRA
jgi:uncharacterized protein YbjT (DUF2867 family)